MRQAERLGVDHVWSAEGWGQDAVTTLAYLAGQTERITLGTGIMQISARTPSMTAMTALSLHGLTGGRFILGLGVSGPQVVEGLHGVAYHAPLTRLKETFEIVRLGFRGEKLSYHGKVHELPRPAAKARPFGSITRRPIFRFFWQHWRPSPSSTRVPRRMVGWVRHFHRITPRLILPIFARARKVQDVPSTTSRYTWPARWPLGKTSNS